MNAVGNMTTNADGSAMSFGQKAANVAGHAAVGCASAAASGGDCESGALSGGFGAAYSNFGPELFDDMVSRTMEHAVVGGVGSVLGGGKFANGAVTGAFGYLFNELLHQECRDAAMRRAAYKETAYPDGTYCNIQGTSGACGHPLGSVPSESMQAGVSGGFTAAFGLGAAYDVGPVRSTNGMCAVMQNVCLVAGPIAGYSVDMTVLNVSSGNPSNGWSASLIDKWAVPIGGFSVAPGYGSDGLTVQAGRSFGVIGGWGAKFCIQEKVGSCGGR